MKRKLLAGALLVGVLGLSACVENTGATNNEEELPDEFVEIYVCADSAATERVLQGENNLRAALNAGIDDCSREFNSYVDFLTAKSLIENGVRPEDGDPSVRRQMAANSRENFIQHFLPIYRRATQ